MKFPSKPTLLGASIACALLSLASPTQASSSLLDEDWNRVAELEF